MKSNQTKRRGGPRGELFKEGGAGGPGRPPVPESERLYERAVRAALAKQTDEVAALIAAAREHAAIALTALIETAANPDHPQRVAAASEILNRGYGRAPQSIEVKAPEGVAVLMVNLPLLREAAQRVLAAPAIEGIALKPRDLIGDAEFPPET